MSISNYPQLQSAIGRWLARGDLASVASDFISLAEARINTDLRVTAFEKIVIVEAVSLSPIETALAIPSDLIDLKQIIVYSPETFQSILKYVGITDANRFLPSTSRPIYYTRVGEYYLLSPNPDATDYQYTLYYYGAIPVLSDNNVTNWLLTNYPNVYLYASLLEATPYLKDDPRIEVWANAYQLAVTTVNNNDRDSAIPDSDIRIRGDVVL